MVEKPSDPDLWVKSERGPTDQKSNTTEEKCNMIEEETQRFVVEKRKKELKITVKQLLGDDDEATQDMENDQARLSVDEEESEMIFQDKAERKAFIKKSKRRRAVHWVNKMLRKNHKKKITQTYVNEELKGFRLVRRRDSGTEVTRAEFEQEKRARLLKAEEERKKINENWLRSQKEKSKNKRLQNIQKSNV
ncbi:hypothetical protein DPEC_G00122930 [Dallia pectoralis]|uniref:Uncharacterized protein n=1 Tax=Dallia pectoralis TaxID=75939 RepID=A0ACC2GQC4_DALPE|nr:hypothetical protein DPEC_G00122930 [Dallia pectoralis]